jgi:septal ring-binding cell division protein DamX
MKKILIIALVFSLQIFAGDDLTAALKALDSGNKAQAEVILKKMQKAKADAPETLLLDALLNENAEEAKAVYEFIYEEYPGFKYADLCLFRLYSYNYAIGNYITAKKYLAELKEKFPSSPYAKAINSLPKPSDSPNIQEPEKETQRIFTIQVGAFTNSQNAKRLADKFRAKGYSVEIGKKIVGSSIFNIETVGVYNSSDDADKRAEKIKTEFGVNARVIKINR